MCVGPVVKAEQAVGIIQRAGFAILGCASEAIPCCREVMCQWLSGGRGSTQGRFGCADSSTHASHRCRDAYSLSWVGHGAGVVLRALLEDDESTSEG